MQCFMFQWPLKRTFVLIMIQNCCRRKGGYKSNPNPNQSRYKSAPAILELVNITSI